MIPSKIKALVKGECFGWEFKPQRKTFGQNTRWGVEIALYSLVLCRQRPTLLLLIQEANFGFAMECLVPLSYLQCSFPQERCYKG